MFRKPGKLAGDEIGLARLVLGLVVLIPGAVGLALLPFIAALTRIGLGGTALFVLGILLLAIAFFPAYQHFKPSSPPTPRRDLAVIVFSALIVGLWTFAFSNEVVAVLVLFCLGAVLLLPDDWPGRFIDLVAQKVPPLGRRRPRDHRADRTD